MSEFNLEIGQEVFITYLHENKPPFRGTIDSIGRVFFTIKELRQTKFRKSDLGQKESTSGWAQTYKVWFSESQFRAKEDEIRVRKLIAEKLPLLNRETLIRIFDIIR